MNRYELMDVCLGRHNFPTGDVTLETTNHHPNDVLSHVDIYWRQVRCDGKTVDVAGIANVCTEPAYRGLGLARSLIRAAHNLGKARGVAYAALWSHYFDFYAPLGYHTTSTSAFLVAPLARMFPLYAEWDPQGQW